MRNKKRLCIWIFISIMLLAMGCVVIVIKKSNESWVKNCRTIAHGFGGIDEYTYTNSMEAFLYNYEKGHRVFEVDFSITADNVLVAVHDWKRFYQMTGRSLDEEEKAQPLTLEQFKESKIYNKYTPLSWKDIMILMQQYPDIYIVTDTKDKEDPMITNAFTQIVNEAMELGENSGRKILKRVIPQIYNPEMYDIICEIYPWKSIIYTLYNLPKNKFSYEEVYQFIVENNIKIVTTYDQRINFSFAREIQDMGGYLYMHTYNDASVVKRLIELYGIHGVYTDYLAPDDVKEVFEK